MDSEKKEIRAAMRRLNRALEPERRAAASERIFTAVERLDAFRRATTVGLFCALGDEPDTGAALRRWAAAGKRIAVPRVEGERMRFFLYDPAVTVRGAFGIEEPGPGAALCAPGELEAVIVPGVAFTAAGERMGRGRGYYDRYLAQPELRAVKIGVCYTHQLADALPVEPHDVRMDHVIAG